eukprot:TRINITY_DN1789_c0_g1_i1.p1 TRINITY_DN1789_c0_g1~~TRINITY_DN1789_c0_g1_i1.p1  ORF type:complete len:272 (+),score=59.18 TRINITY_DN1789_c0_g1_i1:44-859(+)
MGIYLCANDENHTIYDIRTPEQGVAYLCLAAIYFAVEVFYIIRFIWLMKSQKQIIASGVLLLFYTLFHILLIRGVLYSLGGVIICYSKLAYDIIAEYFCSLSRGIVILAIFRISSYIHYLTEMDSIGPFEKSLLAFFAIDTVLYVAAKILNTLGFITYRHFLIYDMVGGVTCVVLFTLLVGRIVKVMRLLPEVVEPRRWKLIIAFLYVYSLFHISYTVFLFVCQGIEDISNQLYPAICVACFMTCFEVLPCLVVIWFLSKVVDHSTKLITD